MARSTNSGMRGKNKISHLNIRRRRAATDFKQVHEHGMRKRAGEEKVDMLQKEKGPKSEKEETFVPMREGGEHAGETVVVKEAPRWIR